MQPNLTVRKFSLPPSLNLSTGYTYVLALTQQFLLVAHFRVYHQIWFSKNRYQIRHNTYINQT